MQRRQIWLAFCVCLVVLTRTTRAENYAFLVAVQDYNVKSLRPLKFTRNDILEFSKALQSSNFKAENIVLMTDKPQQLRYAAEAEKIRTELDLLMSGIRDGDTLIIAFAGHGVQFSGDPKNYFCPLDVNLDDPRRTRLVALSEIYEKLKECPAHRKLLVVDACRKDPQSDLSRARDTIKLNSVTRPQAEAVPKGVVAVFSCSAGQEAYEWPEYQHGVFFHHLLEGWNGAAKSDGDDRSVTLDRVLTYATNKTQNFARLTLQASQTPHVKSDFEGTWVLRRLSEDQQEIRNTIGMKLRLIPAGEFLMGSPESEPDRGKSETQHRVSITKSFYLGKYEVTQTEFRKVMGWNRSRYEHHDGDNKKIVGLDTGRFPVDSVTWYDAAEFCNKLSAREGLDAYYRLRVLKRDDVRSIETAGVVIIGGKGYRLPTEAEWEYACRGGTKTPFHFGSECNGTQANIDGTAPYGTAVKVPRLRRTTTVGQYSPNIFGLHDMHGNASEWCQDWLDEKYYANSPDKDPSGPEVGKYRVMRGGTHIWPGASARSASRTGDLPGEYYYTYGFRVALDRHKP